MMDPDLLRLYLVADPEHAPGDLVPTVVAALAGGVTIVQLRAKRLADRELLALAIRLRELSAGHDVPLIVNDRIDIALAAGTAGVHLGVDDLPLAHARALAGHGFLIGYSPETDEQIARTAAAGADYLGVGPVYGTRTKGDAGAALGIAEFSRRCDASALPVVGIGGITAANASAVVDAGAHGIAVVSAILGAPDPAAAARALRIAVDAARQDLASATR
jgi:thiamine-phosphate diphosphorylase